MSAANIDLSETEGSLSKVLITIGDAAEAMDTLYPVYRVQEDDFEVVVAGPEARVYPLVMHEIPPGWDITREGPSYHLEATVAFRDIDPDDYTGLFLTGGRAPEYLRYDQDLIRIVRHFFEKKSQWPWFVTAPRCRSTRLA